MTPKHIAFAIAALLLMTESALAQARCADRADMVLQLNKNYQEYQAEIGVMRPRTPPGVKKPNGKLVELFVSKDGSFTVLLTSPKNISCMVLYGDSWTGKPGFDPTERIKKFAQRPAGLRGTHD